MVEGSPHVTYCLRSVSKTWDQHTQDLQKSGFILQKARAVRDWTLVGIHRMHFNVGLHAGSFRGVQRVFCILFSFPVVGVGSHSLVAGFNFSSFFIFICTISVSLDDLVEAMLLSPYEKLYDNGNAEAPVLWPTGAKSWLIGKDPDDGKGWGQKEKGAAEDEMVG